MPVYEPGPERLRIFVDGREVFGVIYADTDNGIVKTHDITLAATWEDFDKRKGTLPYPLYVVDDEWLPRFNRADFPADWELDAPAEGVVTRTLRGKVEVKPWE